MHRSKYNTDYPFKPFIFIGERLIYDVKSRGSFLKDYHFKYADKEQVEAIKKIAVIDELAKLKVESQINMYEHELIIEKMNDYHSRTSFIPLVADEYKYGIIELSEFLFDYNLEPALSLMTKDLNVIASIGKIGSYRFDHLKTAVYYSDWNLLHQEPLNLVKEDIDELCYNYEIIDNLNNGLFKDSIIKKSLNDYQRSKHIQYNSPFKIIALFSVIESLLTINSRNTDQSINRQLQKKIKLINNQFDNKKINFFDFFNGPDTLTEEIIIEKLYSYRSKISHGDYSDFNNELQVLGDHKKTYRFLNLLTKRLILFSMENPQLVLDLKEC